VGDKQANQIGGMMGWTVALSILVFFGIFILAWKLLRWGGWYSLVGLGIAALDLLLIQMFKYQAWFATQRGGEPDQVTSAGKYLLVGILVAAGFTWLWGIVLHFSHAD
jgi:cytochrome c biogenesis protein CcdA